jgi:soluble P-type ATPase
MKAVVFDNSGTLIKRYRVIKDLRMGLICDDISTIDVVDRNPHRALVVLQTNPSKCINKARPDQTIFHFLKKNDIKFDVSYSAADVKKEALLDAIKDDNSLIKDIQDTYNSVVEKKYNVQICSGSGFIANLSRGKVEFTVTAGGKIFKEVPRVIEELKNRKIDIFVASGDRKGSLEELAKFIHIPQKNVFGTADSKRKMEIVNLLKKSYKVMMVGNSANDILALKAADVGVLTLQQEENVPKKVYNAADYVINNILEIIDIEF